MDENSRGIVKIKPVYIGLYHYRERYGSVCSPDVKGTPQVPKIGLQEIMEEAQKIIKRFKEKIRLDFVDVKEPFIISSHRDLRRLPEILTYDDDALLVGSMGGNPLEIYTLSLIGLPIIRGETTESFIRALRVKKFLRQSKFLYVGEIPSFSAPYGPWNFYAIEKRFGVRVRHVETNEFYRYYDRIPDDAVKEELEKWRRDFERILEPSEEDLMNAVRVYLTLRYLCEREDANGVTINCGRFTEERPVVPCLAFDRLIDEGIMCACEGDITAMLSSLMLHAVSGQPVLMGNFGYEPGRFEAEEGEVTIEHDIIPLSMASTKYTIRDYHGRGFGVTGYADIKSGEPMTLLNMDSSLSKILVVEGWVKRSEDGIHCRIIIHMDVKGDIERLPDLIVGSQHISMTYGHWLNALKETGKLLNLEVLHL
ncbi:hypothetical protein DRO37_09215 [Candidatus Bathyarchaeota archaeon]|nr:MAG: hypothetical protein DRO37_09215 [Candidatus Bathyarchaeota archaeon]